MMMNQFCLGLLIRLALNSVVLFKFGQSHEEWAVAMVGGEHEALKLAELLSLRYLYESQPGLHVFETPSRSKRDLTSTEVILDQLLANRTEILHAEKQVPLKRVKRDATTLPYNDPMWSNMWYIHNGGRAGYDMKIREAWQAGYTGQGVVVTIIDDGIELKHADLSPNYDAAASYDINGRDTDPTPRYDTVDSNRHGTRCAGVVAAVANNSVCIVGVAYNARIGGIRLLDGTITDEREARAFSTAPQRVDIYSSSWGPDDDGRTVEGPGYFAARAIEKGIREGRGGKGSIYVWASGNGGANFDSCACDGYASSIYTISIGGTSEFGTKPWYLEECASTLASTFSSGQPNLDRRVSTLGLRGQCTDSFTGTSASTPFAAGMIALMLEANGGLTWRDVQHIIVETSRSQFFLDGNFVSNGVGLKFSNRYGFGLMDGEAMVKKAETWITVPPFLSCPAYESSEEMPISYLTNPLLLNFTILHDDCQLNYLEQVQVYITLTYLRRGDISVYLTSPSGTKSHLLPTRSADVLEGSFDDWPLTSVHFWGETVVGRWQLQVLDPSYRRLNNGTLFKWRVVFYGTEIAPESSTVNRTLLTRKQTTLTTTQVIPTTVVPVESTTETTFEVEPQYSDDPLYITTGSPDVVSSAAENDDDKTTVTTTITDTPTTTTLQSEDKRDALIDEQTKRTTKETSTSSRAVKPLPDNFLQISALNYLLIFFQNHTHHFFQ